MFYASRGDAMSGQIVGGIVAAGGNNGDRSLVNSKWSTSITKQHSYEQINHVHSLVNDFSNLYLDDR